MNKETQEDKSIVHISHLSKSFTKGTLAIPVLCDISCSIQQGSTTIVTGESGSGKTTLLSLIAGLDTVDSGDVYIAGQAMHSLNEIQRAQFRLRSIGFVFQYHYLVSDLNAIENVMLPLLMNGYKKNKAYAMAEILLQHIGLSKRRSHYPTQLSGGECQRISIARALVHTPLLVLADEPTGSLDSKNSAMIRELLQDCTQRIHGTLIIASHDLQFLHMSDMQCKLRDGTLTAQSLQNTHI
ncbi:lipoprotein-releasing system ATP-binding protein LolD-like [Ylistrum balloti]|uniref:lipoprotein-releasing system ATP-binding protein LolD-like n=1 Tax=Ylistrum balloti TaxID=509963 RepID=UPI002905CF4C|nr:lipoprotein-releasing system ATP-binding protein LolD-like [Ylistrum balloti]